MSSPLIQNCQRVGALEENRTLYNFLRRETPELHPDGGIVFRVVVLTLDLVIKLFQVLVFGMALFGCREQCRDESGPSSEIEVHFSPHGGCEIAIVKHIDDARSSIFVQAYSFTSRPIGDALVRAHQRHVDVRIVLDRSDRASNSLVDEMVAAGIPTAVDSKHAIAHSKVMVLDRAVVETGSFNFSQAAENANVENCLFIPDRKLAEQYIANWQHHRDHSKSSN